MSEKEHAYNVSVRWIGNEGEGTRNYTSYSRDHEIHGPGKPLIPGSSDPSFRGNSARWNPEEMLVAALSACHKLWYLHLCSQAGVIVLEYRDDATGTMRETEDGRRGRPFRECDFASQGHNLGRIGFRGCRTPPSRRSAQVLHCAIGEFPGRAQAADCEAGAVKLTQLEEFRAGPTCGFRTG